MSNESSVPPERVIKLTKSEAKSSQEKVVRTICQSCHVACGVLVHVRDGEIVKIKGDPEHPLNQGIICPKGVAAKHLVYHPDRLKYPLKRVGGFRAFAS